VSSTVYCRTFSRASSFFFLPRRNPLTSTQTNLPKMSPTASRAGHGAKRPPQSQSDDPSQPAKRPRQPNSIRTTQIPDDHRDEIKSVLLNLTFGQIDDLLIYATWMHRAVYEAAIAKRNSVISTRKEKALSNVEKELVDDDLSVPLHYALVNQYSMSTEKPSPHSTSRTASPLLHASSASLLPPSNSQLLLPPSYRPYTTPAASESSPLHSIRNEFSADSHTVSLPHPARFKPLARHVAVTARQTASTIAKARDQAPVQSASQVVNEDGDQVADQPRIP
jgi:hypothetical protein